MGFSGSRYRFALPKVTRILGLFVAFLLFTALFLRFYEYQLTKSRSSSSSSHVKGAQKNNILFAPLDFVHTLKQDLKRLKAMQGVDHLLNRVTQMQSEPINIPLTARLQFHRSIDRSNTIFVGIPYTHTDTCTDMITNLFGNTTHKMQVTVGLVETHEDLPDDFIDRDHFINASHCINHKYLICNQSKYCPTDFIRRRRIAQSELNYMNSGISFLTHISTVMFRSEKYILLLDGSATYFESGWDEKLISMYKEAKKSANLIGKRAVLSGVILQKDGGKDMGDFCVGAVDENGIPQYKTGGCHVEPSDRVLVSTQFLFAEGTDFVSDLPIDRHLQNISASGLSFILSARLYASNYKVYTPQPVIWRTAEPALTERVSSSQSKNSVQRFRNTFTNPRNIKDKRYVVRGLQKDPSLLNTFFEKTKVMMNEGGKFRVVS